MANTTRERRQRAGESRVNYLQAAGRYARERFNTLGDEDDHYLRDDRYAELALEDTERKFTSLGTCGVEGICEQNGEGHFTIQYLNTGDTYGLTVCYYKGRFVVAGWGDLVESHELNK